MATLQPWHQQFELRMPGLLHPPPHTTGEAPSQIVGHARTLPLQKPIGPAETQRRTTRSQQSLGAFAWAARMQFPVQSNCRLSPAFTISHAYLKNPLDLEVVSTPFCIWLPLSCTGEGPGGGVSGAESPRGNERLHQHSHPNLPPQFHQIPFVSCRFQTRLAIVKTRDYQDTRLDRKLILPHTRRPTHRTLGPIIAHASPRQSICQNAPIV